MKKKVMLALAVIMVLGSVKAMAEEGDDIALLNTEGKIQAAESMMMTDRSEIRRNDSTIGAQIREMEIMHKELLGDAEAKQLVLSLERTIKTAHSLRKAILKSEDLETSRKLLIEISNSLSDFKAMDPRNIIPGLHVHEELRF